MEKRRSRSRLVDGGGGVTDLERTKHDRNLCKRERAASRLAHLSMTMLELKILAADEDPRPEGSDVVSGGRKRVKKNRKKRKEVTGRSGLSRRRRGTPVTGEASMMVKKLYDDGWVGKRLGRTCVRERT